jgi:hypothetical protein
MKYQGPTRKNDQGETAVLYSPGFGAGWSTWADGYGVNSLPQYAHP